ncbi:flagellar export protein FliJ [Anoxynatronum sibiricum]|uniref:Flagellar FliJ protein n=1 Tax=Anoxynatronum sibiricum TaxID=210623 RepID=A0ABU9VQW5_9CLOT
MPKGFEFRFENLLAYKVKKEDEAKMKLGEAVGKLEEEKNRLAHLTEQHEKALSLWHESIHQQVRVSEMQLKSNQIQWFQDLIRLQQTMIDDAEEEVEKCRNILVEAKKETRKFEKIKEKDLESFRETEQKIERAGIDQFVSFKNALK